MEFRRSSQRDDRRRRVLNETVLGTQDESASPRQRRGRSSAGRRRPRKSKNYGDAQFMDEQPRLTDLVPIHWAKHLALFVLGLSVIAGLEWLYAWMPRVAEATTDGRVAAFDLDGEGSLAVWFSSMLLAFGGLTSILVYYVRRHRTDDYHGRYRIWLWAAFCCFLTSLDETASLHEGFKELMSQAAGTRLFGDGSIWWVAPYFFLLGGVGVRLLLDVRESWLSTGMLLVAALSMATAVLAQLGVVLPDTGARGVMLEEGAEMLGFLFLSSGILAHARHVVLDAEGLSKKKTRTKSAAANNDKADEDQKKGDANEPAESDPSRSRTVKIHPAHPISRPTKPAVETDPPQSIAFRPLESQSRKPAAKETAGNGKSRDEAVAGGISPVTHKLSKAERKAQRRQRKLQDREQRRMAG
jgi:hypothetical protein